MQTEVYCTAYMLKLWKHIFNIVNSLNAECVYGFLVKTFSVRCGNYLLLSNQCIDSTRDLPILIIIGM